MNISELFAIADKLYEAELKQNPAAEREDCVLRVDSRHKGELTAEAQRLSRWIHVDETLEYIGGIRIEWVD